jgi:hypothetical protein
MLSAIHSGPNQAGQKGMIFSYIQRRFRKISIADKIDIVDKIDIAGKFDIVKVMSRMPWAYRRLLFFINS